MKTASQLLWVRYRFYSEAPRGEQLQQPTIPPTCMCVPYKGAFHASGWNRNRNPKVTVDSANLAARWTLWVDMRMPHDGDWGRDT
jgi:hypothetical protein